MKIPRFSESFATVIICLCFLAGLSGCGEPAEPEGPAGSAVTVPETPITGAIPVILDTDIGNDIDDTWALALLLECPELDPRLVVTDFGDTRARARLTARFLEEAGRTDIPVGIGRFMGEARLQQGEWAEGYDLNDYPGVVYEDGVQAMIDVIMESPGPVTLIAIGPTPNLADALEREPRIIENVRVIAMSGSVDVGYGGSPEPEPEYNVRADIAGSRAMYEAPWDLLIAPLDTAGTIQLRGDLYQQVLHSEKPSIQALLENYRIWADNVDWTQVDPAVESSVLFDALAIALAVDTSWVEIEEVQLDVTDDGMTRRASDGKVVRSALRWKDRDGFERWLVDRLTR